MGASQLASVVPLSHRKSSHCYHSSYSLSISGQILFLTNLFVFVAYIFMRDLAQGFQSRQQHRWRDADSASESPLQPAHVAQESRPYHYRPAHAGPRHRRQHRHLHRGLRHAAGPVALPNPNQLVIVWSKIRPYHNGVSAGDFTDWKRQSTAFEDLNAWTGGAFNIATKDQPEYIDGRTHHARMLPDDRHSLHARPRLSARRRAAGPASTSSS